MKANIRCGGLSVVLLALCTLAACDSAVEQRAVSDKPGQPAVAYIEGTVLYRERMMLPPGAEVEVQLQDISRPDALATVLATLLIVPEGGPPYDFAVAYDPARIDARLRYALRATIAVDDALMFSSTDYIDPFSGGPVEILVRRVAEPVQHAAGEQAIDKPF